MPDKIVYRSSAAEVLAAIESFHADFRAYREAINAVLDEAGVGRYKIWATTNGWQPGKFLGLDIPEDEFPPKGWRLGKQYAVPDQRYAEGKRVAAAIKAVNHPGDPMRRIPGMPPDILTAGGFSSPGIAEMAGAVYVTWAHDPETSGGSFTGKSATIDPALWERIPLSVYYAAREAEDAEREAGAVA
jgi:hypothetical protein